MKLIDHIAAIRKKVEPVDVDLTTLINRKSTFQDVREKFSGIRTLDLFAFGFSMFSFGIFTGFGYQSGLRTGNKFILSIEQASGIMLIVAGMFLVGFIAVLSAKVRRW